MQKKLPAPLARKGIRYAIRVQLVLITFTFVSFMGFAQNSSALFDLVKDINATPTSSLNFNNYSQWKDVNGTLFFVLNNRQLWKVAHGNPTAELLREFESVNSLSKAGNELYFAANDGVNGTEIWKTDGTQSGTVLVMDVNPGFSGSDPTAFTEVNGTVYFSANDGSRGRELWKTNGTVAGTMIVTDLMRVIGSSNPSNLVSMNGLLFFVANDGQHGYEIWKTDGTPSGTQLVKDLRTQYKVGSLPRELINVDGKLFFVAFDNYTLRRLWVSDGTSDGTLMVANVSGDSTSAESGLVNYMLAPTRLTNVNGTLYFVAKDAWHGTELWKSNGTAESTALVKDIVPGTGSPQYLHYLTSNNGRLYFVATSSYDLWISDGTEEGTKALTQSSEIRLTGFPDLTAFNGMIYFLGLTSDDTLNIFRVAHTPESVESVVQSTEGYYALTHLTAAGNYLYYVNQGTLWRTDGVNSQAINGIYASTESSNPEGVTVINGMMYFNAFDGISNGLWKSNGTEAGTTLVHRFEGNLVSLTQSGNYVYYWADAIDSDTLQLDLKLWRTDLTTGESTWVSDINMGGGDYIAELEDVNGTLFFSIEVPMIPGQEFPREAQLWKTTGTLASTEYIKSFNEEGIPPIFLTNLNGTLFFSAMTDPNVGNELWKSDGTSAGTVMVKKINPNPLEPSEPAWLMNFNNTLFFSAYTGQYELWKSDGTEEGTVRVKDVNPFGLTILDDTLYFSSGSDLWKSDGTEMGTIKVANFTAPEGQTIYRLHILGKLNNEVIVGTSHVDWTFRPGAIWKTNGTEGGTQIILSPVDNLTNFTSIIEKENHIYFAGSVLNTPDYDLWRTDGTTCGTFSIMTEGNPGPLVQSNGTIFLPWTSETFGRELFQLDESEIHAPCSSATSTVARAAVAYETLEGNTNETLNSYPNPFISEMKLNVQGDDGRTYNANVVDMKGNTTSTYTGMFFNTDYSIGSELRPGVYLLKVNDGSRILAKKIIKTP